MQTAAVLLCLCMSISGVSCVFDKHWKGTVHCGTQGLITVITRDTETYSINLEVQVHKHS